MKFLNDTEHAAEWFSESGDCSVPIYDLFSLYGKKKTDHLSSALVVCVQANEEGKCESCFLNSHYYQFGDIFLFF